MERTTRQRTAIQSALEKAGRPLSPREIHAEASTEMAGIGMATVYRAIRQLLEVRSIVEVALPGEPARYEPSGLHHHHHFHCNGCGRLFDLPGCPGEFKSLLPRNFRLEGHELILYGRCPACATPTTGRAKR